MTEEQANSEAEPGRPEAPAVEPVKDAEPAKDTAVQEAPAKAEPAAIAPAPRAEGEPDMPLLRIEGVAKKFGNFRAVDHVTLDIRAGEFFALLGPSGCGKTTLLRMLAGFETPDEGRILLNGKDIAPVMPHERPVNMMFQNYALFPHLSVRDNIAFGLKRAGMARADIKTRVAEMVALGMTFIVVTHDQEEAMTMADRIGVMDAGRLEQVASPRDLYETPASRWIAEFVGDINLFEGQVGAVENGRLAIETRDGGTIYVAEPRNPLTKSAVSVAIRPEKVKLSRRGPAVEGASATAFNRMEGVITDVSYLGGVTTYKVRLDSGAIMRSVMANTTRLLDTYTASQRVVAWNNERAANFREAGAICGDRALSVDGAVLPGAVRLRAEDRAVADRDRAAALYAGV
ncbi:Vitamin B12 import ATP-binding protein BtuD [subsurface metagenome]